ncbi:MAG: type II toxin-antitoxin system Phd/YefM family antitoxin [Ignavibacteriales bacterium]|nr:type II toxin-antitoxin system Phd/YefM family antitoxin [Ignavibacteriales bacterium]
MTLRTQLRTFDYKGRTNMKTITITEARNNIYKLIDMTTSESEPIQITGKRGNAVLISEDDWRAIKETLYLTSIPGMRESIIKGMKEPLSNTTNKIKW